jgi:hypothetical protein
MEWLQRGGQVPPRVSPSRSHQRVVEASVREPQAHLVVLLGGEAGLRRGEMIGLEWTDVNLTKRQLCVARSDWRGPSTARLPPTPSRKRSECIRSPFSQRALLLRTPTLHLRFPADSVLDTCKRFRVDHFDRTPCACIGR